MPPFPHHKNNPSFPFLSCLILSLLLATMTTVTKASDCVPFKPTTPLLSFFDRLQGAAFTTFGKSEFDAKEYVDMSLKSPLPETQHAFDQLPKSANGTVPPQDLKHFITEYFEVPGEDIVLAEPEDYVSEPEGFLEKVKNPEVRAWALEVHSLWRNLTRKVAGSVHDQPELHTLLPLPNRFVIPGSSYREVYYWDSYWVIRGLLASKMYDTAKAILGNLIFLLEEYGYVLNGARSYYTNRSQPPLLSAMVQEIVKRTGDVELAAKALPALIKEHEFWNSGIHKVTVQDGEAQNYALSRYYAMWNKPLPESSEFAKEHASKIPDVYEKERFYLELASACESGWDFSTRWMRNHSDFTTLATTSILPVDLNAFLLQMELDIASLAKVAEVSNISERFQKASEARLKALKTIFWNEEKGQWLDYWLNSSTCNAEEQTWEATNQNHNVFASNFVPLWLESFYSDASLVEKVMKSFKSSGLLCDAGIATSLTNSTQQWDFPNGWAPLQHMIVEGLVKSGSKEAKVLAEDIAVRWIRTNYVTYKKTGAMHEKYDVEKCGQYGGPGKQIGFGWTNGVVLAFLEEFGWPEDIKIDC